MLVDCEKCEVRNVGCADCVISFMLTDPVAAVEISDGERRALDVLAEGGMLPPLRLTISDERAS
ncbi:hypothetical protein Airi02_008210 [Actinoallomurus iriomotensis]|jgi:hypothetical protein|uniref:Uncharacterized protein n=2 Tax=Thermomonosporaceae TaxID=2012 RepID=A0A9W6RA39_9ACTN|nr:hypothetical protein Airi01_003610 [Actinoallomurus iriomotensis]GLY82891.1 hypothetical protein Airi02_008210 [Actinoallomurus iriomotensis]